MTAHIDCAEYLKVRYGPDVQTDKPLFFSVMGGTNNQVGAERNRRASSALAFLSAATTDARCRCHLQILGYDIVPSEKWDYVKDMMTTLVKRCVDAEREEMVVYVDKYKVLKGKLLAVPGVQGVKQARDPGAYLPVPFMATACVSRSHCISGYFPRYDAHHRYAGPGLRPVEGL